MDSMTVLTFISQPFKIEKVQINKVDVGSHKFGLVGAEGASRWYMYNRHGVIFETQLNILFLSTPLCD